MYVIQTDLGFFNPSNKTLVTKNIHKAKQFSEEQLFLHFNNTCSEIAKANNKSITGKVVKYKHGGNE